MSIQHIIFDWGKVIIDIDPDLTIKKLSSFADSNTFFQNEAILLFELGKISEDAFFSQLQKNFLNNGDITSVIQAWDSMITGISYETISLLKILKNKFPLYALSNTNSRHLKIINQYLLKNHDISNIKELFTKVYLSFELGIAKPDREIFEHVLQDNQLLAETTLFIDDNIANIKIANNLNFKTIHLTKQYKLREELHAMGIL